MDPKPGDLIEIFRGGYQHWAVYIGDGYVVHLVTPDGSGGSSTISGGSEMGEVRKEKLTDVVNKDDWIINNLHDMTLKHRPKEEVVKAALSWVGRVVEYSVTNFNCEHFATRCRYGKSTSSQVLKAVGGAAILGAGVLLASPLAVVGGLFLVGNSLKAALTSTSTSESHLH